MTTTTQLLVTLEKAGILLQQVLQGIMAYSLMMGSSSANIPDFGNDSCPQNNGKNWKEGLGANTTTEVLVPALVDGYDLSSKNNENCKAVPQDSIWQYGSSKAVVILHLILSCW
jgi:hypothetical protein